MSYASWQHCYSSLKLSGNHKRGSSLFFRYIKYPDFQGNTKALRMD